MLQSTRAPFFATACKNIKCGQHTGSTQNNTIGTSRSRGGHQAVKKFLGRMLQNTEIIHIWPHHTSHIIHILQHDTSHIIHLTTSRLTTSLREEVLGPGAMRSITHQTTKNEENTKEKFLGRVLGPDGRTPNLTTSHITHSHLTTSHITHSHLTTSHITHHSHLTTSHIAHHSHLTTHISPHHTSHILHISPHHTSHIHISPHHTSHILHISPHHTSHIHISPHHTSQAEITKKYEFYCENPVKDHPRPTKSTRITTKNEHPRSWRAERPKGPKSTSFIMKTPLRTIREQQKVRELPRKMKIEEVPEPKKYENYHAKPVSDPFKTIAEHRKVRELPRKMNIEEVEEPETTKITTKIPRPTTAATRNVRELPRKLHIQARKHVNSDEFRPPPRSSTPAFYYYRKNPKC